MAPDDLPAAAGDLRWLDGIALCAGLDDACRRGLVEGGSVVNIPAGRTLFAQGQRPEVLHVLLQGCVALEGISGDGRHVPIELIGAGGHFILAAVLRDAPYLMGAQSLGRCRLLLLPAETFRRRLQADARLAVAAATALAGDFRGMVREAKSLKLKPPLERLAAYLLSLAGGDHGPAVLVLPAPAGIVAGLLGMTPETYSRCLRRLGEVGVSGRGRRIEVSRLERLAALCVTADLPD